jgi:hypothetical protein
MSEARFATSVHFAQLNDSDIDFAWIACRDAPSFFLRPFFADKIGHCRRLLCVASTDMRRDFFLDD